MEPIAYINIEERKLEWATLIKWETPTIGKMDKVPLYAAPPKKEWVGLTGEERNDCLVEADPCEALAEPEARQLMEEVEAKLKEKNGG
jgi:hypothetical protein